MRGDTLVIAAASEGRGVVDGMGGVNPATDGMLAASGAVFVYGRSGSMWTNPTYLKAFAPQTSDRFGNAIALDGDLLAVGATGEDSGVRGLGHNDDAGLGATDSGAVYTFRRDAAGAWSAEDYFKAEASSANARYGSSLAIWGNLLFVGARAADNPEPVVRAGVVSLYVHSGEAWSYDSDQGASDADPDDEFGTGIGVSEHGLVVGATGEDGDGSNPDDNSAPAAGAAYSFEPAR